MIRGALRPGRLAAGAVLLLAAAIALAGCVSIPTSGGVGTQKIAEQQGSDDTTIRAANPPRAGASPSEIVAGFVRAGGNPQGGYGVAKSYLTTAFQSRWKPAAATIVSDSTIDPSSSDDGSDGQVNLTVALTVSAQIDASGVYSATTSAERDLRFHLVKERGQWRIDRAPDATVLRTRDLNVVARPYDLYFFDPQYAYLVPDRRWFVDLGGPVSVPQRIVGALLAGPAPYLASPVVVSAFPAETALGDTPAIDGGTLTVDFSSSVLDASAQQQARMLEQLTLSLRSVAVTAVKMTANHIEVPTTDPATAVADPDAFYEAIGSDGKLFGAVTGSAVAPLALGSAVLALEPTAVALGRDRTTAAVLGAGGVSLVSTGAHPVVDARAGLLAPSLDPGGWVWSAQSDPGTLVAARADGKPHALPLPVSGQLVSIAVSRDGTRLLAGLATDAGARLLVFGIQRDKDGVPLGFGTPLEVAVDTGRPIIAAAWVDSETVATLAGSIGGQDAVTEHALGGLNIEHGFVRDGRVLAAGANGTGFSAVRVLLGSGELDQPSIVNDWQSTGVKLALLGTQQ